MLQSQMPFRSTNGSECAMMAAMQTIDNETLLASLRWRYATKQFDATKTIPAETWSALEQALVLTPSSYGTQPYRFLVITDPAIKAKLVAISWNQKQPLDCSHLVVFAGKTSYTAADIAEYMQVTAAVRGVPVESVAGFGKMLESDLILGARSHIIPQWAALQAYIALGNFMTCAALLGVDTCPMEGISPAEYDKVLGLEGSGYGTCVACPAGYRAEGDKYAALPKVRFPADVLIKKI